MRKKQNMTPTGTIKDQFNKDCVEVVTSDLRALLFWANVGVGGAFSGSRDRDILNIIKSYSEYILFQIKYSKFKKEPKRKRPNARLSGGASAPSDSKR